MQAFSLYTDYAYIGFEPEPTDPNADIKLRFATQLSKPMIPFQVFSTYQSLYNCAITVNGSSCFDTQHDKAQGYWTKAAFC